METLNLVIALVRRFDGKTLRWLARPEPATGLLRFVTAQPIERENSRETVGREVAWELGLDRSRDLLVSNMAQMNLEYSGRLPNFLEPLDVRVAFYNVDIYRSAVAEELSQDSQNTWVLSEEICAGVTQDGRRFDPQLTFLINQSSVIQSWESTSGQ